MADPTPPDNAPSPSPSPEDRRDFSPFTRRAATVVGLTAAVIVLLLFAWTISRVLLVLFAGMLLAMLLGGLARRLATHTPLPYGWSLAAVVVGLVGALALGVWMMAPSMSEQFEELAQTLPESIEQLAAWVRAQPWGASLMERVPDAQTIADGSGGSIWGRITGVVSRTVEVLGNIVVILAVGLYLAANPALYRRGVVRLVPVSRRPRADEVLGAVGGALESWLTGTVIAMTIVGIVTWIGLSLLGVPMALALGFIAGLLEFVPIVGPFAASVPAILIAFLQSPEQGLYVALFFLGVQQLEGNVITPLVMKEVVSLPPVLTLAATIVAGVLFGLPGVLIATPLTVALMVLVRKLYIEDVLGDRDA